MFSDYHVHSEFSFDSEEKISNIIKKAISLNMKQIAITDHQDFNWPVKGEVPLIDLPEYDSTISDFKHYYENQIEIIKGIELGLMDNCAEKYHDLFDHHSFDFVIGSCHIVDNMDPYYSQFWENRDDRMAFELYFNTLYNGLLSFNKIDTLGHFDYIVRYSPNKNSNYSVYDYTDIIDMILKYIISNDIKLELNTSNLAKELDFINPHNDIIKRYKELGGSYVTIGSDAHKSQDIGCGFDFVKNIIDYYDLKIFTL